MKVSKRVFALAMGLMMVSMVGCTSNEAKDDNTATVSKTDLSQSTLDTLTITHVTSPLNVPSIIQKDQNIFAQEFEKNGKPVEVKYAEITSGADQTQALASGDIDVLYAVGGTSVVLAAANGADICIADHQKHFVYTRKMQPFNQQKI